MAVPDEVVEHRPAACEACGTPLDAAPIVVRERRQVYELPRMPLRVTDHQRFQVRCPLCARVSTGAFAAEAASRAQYGPRLRALAVYLVQAQFVPFGRTQQPLAGLFGTRLGRGSVVGWVQQAARTLEPVDVGVKAALVRAGAA